MGYVVAVYDERFLDDPDAPCFVLAPNGTWSSRLKRDPLMAPPAPGNQIRIFGSEDEAAKEASHILVTSGTPSGKLDVVKVS